MTLLHFLKTIGAGAALAVFLLGGMLISSRRGQAFDNDGDGDESKIQQGFAIAPVPLNLAEKNRALVGLGSYIVNAQADCNGCHYSPDLGPEFSPGGDPYSNQHPTVVNPAAYLGGGRVFAVFPGGAVIQSRNLTPDRTGRPEGGHTFEEFRTILRTGKDFDHIHPPCPTLGSDGCIQPFVGDGDLLQIMPWPVYANMSDHDIRAIYEYLSAIPCIAHKPNTPGLLPGVYNTCP
jgi:hypothetical protein